MLRIQNVTTLWFYFYRHFSQALFLFCVFVALGLFVFYYSAAGYGIINLRLIWHDYNRKLPLCSVSVKLSMNQFNLCQKAVSVSTFNQAAARITRSGGMF